MRRRDSNVIWNKDLYAVDSSDKRFDAFMQFSSDKTATTLKITTFVLSPVQAVGMKFGYRFRRWLIETSHKFAGFLPVSNGMTNGVQ